MTRASDAYALRWRPPKGDTYAEVIMDAARQVVANYRPALRALALHDAHRPLGRPLRRLMRDV